jgi:dipeptidyl aminopeptidase/acylaminoacyl peptidase
METPYGSWPSPLGPELLAASGVGLAQVTVDEGDLYWLERRPTERGRQCVVRRTPDGAVADMLPPGWNARTLVHEYGGADFAVHRGQLHFANFEDQRLYRVGADGEPVPITPAPAVPRGDRYANMAISADGRRIYAVRERHFAADPSAGGGEREPRNELVMLPADGEGGEPVVVATGGDFYSTPTLHPDGTALAWVTWDHPRMPWDGTELWEAPLGPDGVTGAPRKVAGGPRESVLQPLYGPDGSLWFVSDRTGWWNLYRRSGPGAGARHVAPIEGELGVPQWVLGMRTFALLGADRVVCQLNQGGVTRLAVIDDDGGEGRVTIPDLPYTAFSQSIVATGPARAATIAASPSEEPAVVEVDLATPGPPKVAVIKRSLDLDAIGIDRSLLPPVEPIEFPTAGGRVAYAIYHPPTNPAVTAPAGELPPLLVNSHGGPTSQTPAMLDLGTVFWTSRGFGVVYVNYGGSTGYGRAYRERLDGAWGVVDVEDCTAAARHLAERGSVDPKRLAIRGGSAGGYTTLCALTFTDAFAAGVSYYGVADAAALAAETHKFESRYLDGLIGPWPEAADVYRERSPIHHTDQLSCPILLLQGLDDKVVPPSQAEHMAAALRAKGVPHAYIAFEGEAHGFRQTATIRRCAEVELSFYGQVFGFTPAGDIPELPLES